MGSNNGLWTHSGIKIFRTWWWIGFGIKKLSQSWGESSAAVVLAFPGLPETPQSIVEEKGSPGTGLDQVNKVGAPFISSVDNERMLESGLLLAEGNLASIPPMLVPQSWLVPSTSF